VIPLRYKPERRFVARLTQPSASFVIKVYDNDDFEAIRKRGKQFASAGALVVAEPVGHRTRHCALLFDWIDGATVIDLAARGSPEGVAAATNLGESLREIHRHSPSKAIPKCDMECLGDWVTREMNALDDVVERSPAREIADRIMARLTGHAWGKTGLHGDFSHDQAIIRNRQAVVFDFDRAMRGDPWIDLGRFIASLELEVIRGRIDAAARDALTHGFLAGYGEGSFDESHVGNAFVALQLLVRAQEPFRLRWLDWRCASERIVARARHLAEDKRCASR
jgi:aminoglycoside phosphotransferase (APT) family kinase protein